MRRAGAWSPRLSSYYCLGVLLFREDLISAAAAVYQIPDTEHMAYRLVRTLVYKRGVGIRETVVVIKCGQGPKA